MGLVHVVVVTFPSTYNRLADLAEILHAGTCWPADRPLKIWLTSGDLEGQKRPKKVKYVKCSDRDQILVVGRYWPVDSHEREMVDLE